ncbi:YkuS family protein [Bacillus shivajii]|uniref:YkuS family protein n=1 Tax=Bacillus shivajii TaxID=1983719 RepID=UPI001CFAED43|nr:YkuS family protein [Bacillus shivajii]UCZ51896.1 YkuS family protein [Bacillus shivajii]
MARIGVEQSLSDVQEALQAKGHEIVQLQQEHDAEGCDCCVITGQDQNVMGEQQTVTEGAVINAHGLTAEEICQQVESRVNQQ